MSRMKHTKVFSGKCPVCGHYGESCTGSKPMSKKKALKIVITFAAENLHDEDEGTKEHAQLREALDICLKLRDQVAG